MKLRMNRWVKTKSTNLYHCTRNLIYRTELGMALASGEDEGARTFSHLQNEGGNRS